MKFIEEFKKFALRGNVLDMAVGVIVGGAFSKIVSSMVNDMIMPIIGVFTGKINISSLSLKLPSSIAGGDSVVIKYGQFLQNVLDFTIICLCVFFMIKLVNKLIKKHEDSKPTSKPTNTIKKKILSSSQISSKHILLSFATHKLLLLACVACGC